MIDVYLKKKARDIFISLKIYLFRVFIRKPDVFISFGISIGDDLLCTIIAEQLRAQGFRRIWMGTRFPGIFKHNPHVDRVLIQNENGAVSLFYRKYLKSIPVRFVQPWYTSHDFDKDQDIIPDKHIVKIMCEKAGVIIPSVIKPNFYLTEAEKEKGKLFPNQVCIQSAGLGARLHMKTKDWIPERFAAVAEQLSLQHTVIQLGSEKDSLLPGVVDMRGKTSIREVAAILYHSKFFVGQVGFLMHLARAVNCRSVIVYGGRERPDQSGYEENINLYAAVPCSPCWYWNNCPNDKICMHEIGISDVLQAIEQLISECISDKEVPA